MSNVINIEQFKPQKIDTPIQWVKCLLQKKIKSFRDNEKKKIDALFDATYEFYLDLHLTGVDREKLVDIHPVLYKKRYTICTLAYHQAMEALIPILEDDKVNECYKNLQKYVREKNKKTVKANSKSFVSKKIANI